MIPKVKLASFVVLLAAILVGMGCVTSGPKPPLTPTSPTNSAAQSPDWLSVGDVVQVTFSGVSTPPKEIQDRIRIDGMITLEKIGDIKAAGKTLSELQRDIHRAYVEDGKFYADHLGVHVTAQSRVFYVSGEVKQPNRYPWQSQMTVLKAINSAGGFTDFANRSAVVVTRSTGEKVTVNCRDAERNSTLDLPVYPEDQILVVRAGLLDFNR